MNINYELKYIKYKNKYFSLKKQYLINNINNQIGGGQKTAENFMIAFFNIKDASLIEGEDDTLKQFIEMSDEDYNSPTNIELLRKLKEENKDKFDKIKIIRENNKKNSKFAIFLINIKRDINVVINVDLTIASDKLKKDVGLLIDITKNLKIDIDKLKNTIEDIKRMFEFIYMKLLVAFLSDTKMLDNYIDFIIKCYLNNTFGQPSSLENIGRFKDNILKYKLLSDYNSKKLRNLSNFTSLMELETYIDSHEIKEELRIIYAKRDEEETRRLKEIELRRLGETKPIYETTNVLIYNPQTIEQSRYYGSGTAWCTAAENNNMFDHYKSQGELYIIIGKNKPQSTQKKESCENPSSIIKFQLHIESESLMDDKDDPINIYDMLKLLNNDGSLLEWLCELLSNSLIDNNILNFDFNKLLLQFNPDEQNTIIRKILDKTLTQDILELKYNYNNIEILKLLSKRFPTIKKLSFLRNFNKQLDNSLESFTNLTHLEFSFYELPLGNSLEKLRNLTHLKFNYFFNQPLENSLNTLINLTHLSLGDGFNQPLGTSLDKLINLTHLEFGYYFNKLLDNSLDKLKKLIHLKMDYNYFSHIDSKRFDNFYLALTKLDPDNKLLKLNISYYDNFWKTILSQLIN